MKLDLVLVDTIDDNRNDNNNATVTEINYMYILTRIIMKP